MEFSEYNNKDIVISELERGEEIYIFDDGRGLTDKESNQKIEDWLDIHPEQRDFLDHAKLWNIDRPEGTHYPELSIRKVSEEKAQIKIHLIPNFNSGISKEIVSDYSMEMVREFLEFFLGLDSSFTSLI